MAQTKSISTSSERPTSIGTSINAVIRRNDSLVTVEGYRPQSRTRSYQNAVWNCITATSRDVPSNEGFSAKLWNPDTFKSDKTA